MNNIIKEFSTMLTDYNNEIDMNDVNKEKELKTNYINIEREDIDKELVAALSRVVSFLSGMLAALEELKHDENYPMHPLPPRIEDALRDMKYALFLISRSHATDESYPSCWATPHMEIYDVLEALKRKMRRILTLIESSSFVYYYEFLNIIYSAIGHISYAQISIDPNETSRLSKIGE